MLEQTSKLFKIYSQFVAKYETVMWQISEAAPTPAFRSMLCEAHRTLSGKPPEAGMEPLNRTDATWVAIAHSQRFPVPQERLQELPPMEAMMMGHLVLLFAEVWSHLDQVLREVFELSQAISSA